MTPQVVAEPKLGSQSLFRGLFEDDMRVGIADARRYDARIARPAFGQSRLLSLHRGHL